MQQARKKRAHTGESRYRQKNREREEGTRAPFEFKAERPREPASEVSSRASAQSDGWIIATVTVNQTDHGFAFMTSDMGKLYLPIGVLDRDVPGLIIKIGMRFKCRVGLGKPNKAAPVVEISLI